MNGTDYQKLHKKFLLPGLQELGINPLVSKAIWNYLLLLEKWNQTYNLTAISGLADMMVYHALDGLAVNSFVDSEDKTLIDVGTGGGIPGVLLAIVRPDLSVTLLDAVGKKVRFLRQVKRILSLHNVTVVHSRVENYSPSCFFDVVISRAFSEVNQFLAWTQHLGDRNTRFLAMKGPREESVETGSAFIQVQEDELVVPFLNEVRKLHQYRIK